MKKSDIVISLPVALSLTRVPPLKYDKFYEWSQTDP